MNHCANAIAIGFSSNQLDSQAVIGAAIVAEKSGRSTVRGHNYIEIAVIVDVGIGCPTRDARTREICSHLGRSLSKLSLAEIAKQVRRLCVVHSLLNGLNLIFYMAVRHQDIRPAVEIIVKEKTAEPDREQARASELRSWGCIHKESVTLVVIEREHLV